MFLRLWLIAGILSGMVFSLQAQTIAQAREAALQFLQSNPQQFNLSRQDVSEVRIADAYVSKHNGVAHIWVQQQHAGIPVHEGLFGLHVKPDGSVLHLGHRFIPDLAQRANTTLPSLGAARALDIAAAELGFSGLPTPALKRKTDERNLVFEGGSVSRSDIPVSACYELDDQGQPRLAWLLILDQMNTTDRWMISVDAQTGRILHRSSLTLRCDAGHTAGRGTIGQNEKPGATDSEQDAKGSSAAAETYRVFALPVESPNFGNRSLLTDPADPVASPYGWLDDNGQPGAEYTYTRGNNVWAFDDSANDNVPTPAESADGGPNHVFDFPFDPNAEPVVNLPASLTNMFYANNMIHDIAYRFGFDEPAGNFQLNNYGHGGEGNDPVMAQALDGSGQDNSEFVLTPDGDPGIMQMYRWGQRGGLVKVNAPTALVGIYDGQPSNTGGTTGWGAPITTTPVTAQVVVADNGSGSNDAHLNCTPPANNLQGKIAIVDRGVCQFSEKAYIAQQAGAVGCIICNFEDATIGMLEGDYGASVNIPVIMMKKSDCDLLRQYAGNGLNISLVKAQSSGPDFLDAAFDHSVVLHEYAHGISSRLTGGPANFGCLLNEEGMGEGWSDFFALALTAQPGDNGATPRGIGTYVWRQTKTGGGIRRFPYSTNMSVNPLTFGNVAENPETHALGEVWTAVTWDLYWAMVEKYGFDSDLSNLNSGNARAIQLVMDGLKLQPCRPGFMDGRDAIMKADSLDYGGANTCLISEVFARRGMGYLASQGDNNNGADGIENFDPIPACVKTLKIEKITTTPLVKGGEEVHFRLTVTNHKDEPVTDVVVMDPLPVGWQLLSASNGGVLQGGIVTWQAGTLASGQVLTLDYTARSDNQTYSQLKFADDMETEGTDWLSYSNLVGVSESFFLQNDSVKVGSFAWKASDLGFQTDQLLQRYTNLTVSGSQPVLRFWHNYNSQAGSDAGFLEIQIAGESVWRRLSPEKVFRNGYTGKIQYGTFAIPFLNGFSGNSGGWVRSYFDLSEFIGKDINLQFRFGTDENTYVPAGGWWVDRVELIDMVNFDLEACVSSAEGDIACDGAPERGVIMDTEAIPTAVDQPVANALGLRVQPNPADDVLSFSLGEAINGPARIFLLASDGRVVAREYYTNGYAGQQFALDVRQLPAGIYVLRVESGNGSSVVKVAIH